MASRPQFSIRLALAGAGLNALVLGAIVAPPSWQSGAFRLLAATLVPAPFIAGILRTRGWLRAFCAGAVVPAFLAPYVVAIIFATNLLSFEQEAAIEYAGMLSSREAKVLLIGVWVPIPLCGAACVLFHWLLADGSDERG
jgi:hypothetical protein